MAKYRRDRLERLLSHAYTHVPFFRERFQAAGLQPGRTMRFEDLRRLRPSSRVELREAGLKQTTSDDAALLDRVPNRTAGSTGTPFEFMMDRQLLGWKHARYLYTVERAGLRLGDRYARLWGQRTASFAQDVFGRRIFGRTELDALALDEAEACNMLERLRGLRPPLLESYASSATFLAQCAIKHGICVRIPVVITSAETLYNYQRETIARALDAVVVNRYGSREFGTVAQECRHGTMHVLETSFHLEELDGKLLVTCFDNEAMPFIRYDIGDLGKVDRRPCPCGLTTQVIDDLNGRSSQVYETALGQRVPPTYFYYAVDYHFGAYVRDFQVVLRGDRAITVLVVPGQEYTPGQSAKLKTKLTSDLAGVAVEVCTVDAIARSSAGKRQGIVREYG